MALVQRSVKQVSLEENMTVSGYLTHKGFHTMTDAKTGKVSDVPKMVFQAKENLPAPIDVPAGAYLSFLLGTTAKDTMPTLVLGQFTVVTKEKKEDLGGGQGFYPYSIAQDPDDTIKVSE